MKKLFLIAVLLCLSGCGGSGSTTVTVTFSPADSATDQVFAVEVTATFSGAVPAPSDWGTVFTLTVAGDTTNLCTSYVWDETTRVVTCAHAAFAKNIQYRAAIAGLTGVTDTSATFTTASGMTVFVTSTTHDGNFGGVVGADTLCAERVAAAGLPGTFRAWLSAEAVGLTPAVNARDRIVDAVYIRVDGRIIARSLAELLTGPLQNAIDLDESGNQVSGENNVWSGSWADGTFCETDNCDGWTTGTNLQDAIIGSTNVTADSGWSFGSASANCDMSMHVYCFQISE